MSEFITYEKFATLSELKEFVELLQANDIKYELEEDVQLFDASFANIQHHRDYRIQLLPDDFERVNEIRNNVAISELDLVDSDYYLFDFTNEELIDLISKQDEWSPFDFQLAQKILKDRGQEISIKEINKLKDRRIVELSEPEKHNPFWIVVGYIFAALGGLLGIIIGWYIVFSKKTLPNGQRIYTYNEADRNHGKRILIIGIPILVIVVLIRLFITLELLSH